MVHFNGTPVSLPCLLQVPTIVKNIYQWLSFTTDASNEHSLIDNLEEMALAQPHDVVMTLLRCAPTCDRYQAHWSGGLRIPQPERP